MFNIMLEDFMLHLYCRVWFKVNWNERVYINKVVKLLCFIFYLKYKLTRMFSVSERDFIGFDDKGNRVLYMTSEADLADMDEDKITFRKSFFKK